MKWLPPWLGTAYARLYVEFGIREFQVAELTGLLGYGRTVLRTLVSELAERGYLTRVRRGRYLVKNPLNVIFEVANVAGPFNLRQKVYEPLLQATLTKLFEQYQNRLTSVLLYGSVARGEADQSADLDLLVVIRDLPTSFSERAEQMANIVRELRPLKLGLWREKGVFANLDLLPLSPSEAEVLRPLYLDFLVDAVLLYDKEDFMKRVLARLRARLEALKARRVTLPSGKWYWSLAPASPLGVAIQL